MARILCKGGTVFDGDAFLKADVLTEGLRVVRIAPDIKEEADYIFDVAGCIVAPGLVDAHVHIRGLSGDNLGVSADLATIPFGVTAAADASGNKGDRTLMDSFLIRSRVFVRATIKDNQPQLEQTERMLAVFGDRAVGIKTYCDSTAFDIRDISPFVKFSEFAAERGYRNMLHCANSPLPMAELVSTLRAGDTLTHAYHGGTNNASVDGYECLRHAKEKGVFVDAGLAGHVNVDFEVLRGAIAYGAAPDIISSDLTKLSTYKRGGRYGLPMCMSIAKHLGMEERDIFRAVTSTPAKALGMGGEWGCLRAGGIADLAVLCYEDEGFDLVDKAGHHVTSEQGYRCRLTILNGEIVYRT